MGGLIRSPPSDKLRYLVGDQGPLKGPIYNSHAGLRRNPVDPEKLLGHSRLPLAWHDQRTALLTTQISGYRDGGSRFRENLHGWLPRPI
jgi:hypothetical protein